jgi:hypothetical protein
VRAHIRISACFAVAGEEEESEHDEDRHKRHGESSTQRSRPRGD